MNGDYKVGEWMTADKRVPLVSATGSIRMGKIVAQAVAARLGRSLLELGGNNAIIITPDADLKMVIPATVFGAVGTCGQRCTSTRRLIIHSSIYDKVKDQLIQATSKSALAILWTKTTMGPLIDTDAVQAYLNALDAVVAQGGTVLVPGGQLEGPGYEWVLREACHRRVTNELDIVQHETFAPILYLMKYDTLRRPLPCKTAWSKACPRRS